MLEANNLISICEPFVKTMWDRQHLTSLLRSVMQIAFNHLILEVLRTASEEVTTFGLNLGVEVSNDQVTRDR
jgi:hypothetical protein